MKHKLTIIAAVVAAFAASAKACTLEQLNERMPQFLAHNMRAGQGFKQLLDDAIALRTDCAKRTSGENPEEYGIAVKSYKQLAECEEAFDAVKSSNEIARSEKIVRFSTLFSTSTLFSKGTDQYQEWFLKAFQNLYGISTPTPSVVAPKRNMNRIEAYLRQIGFSKTYLCNDPGLSLEVDIFLSRILNPAMRNTELCNIMRQFGSDKSTVHNYTVIYDYFLKKRRSESLSILEVGIGTNNEDVKSNMGRDGVPGASLRGWAQYFPKAKVFGADIDKRILFQENRISTYYVDQTDPVSVQELLEQIPEKEFDLIIDDGLHEFYANRTLFNVAFNSLKKGGLYIVEDINLSNIHLMIEMFKNIVNKKILISVPILPLRSDNILLFIFK